MSTHLHGAGGAPGIALGRAVRYLPAQPQATAPDADPATALARFADAQARAVASLNALAERLHSEGRPNEAAIFEAQALLADDPGLTDEVARRVRDEGTPLDAAVTATTAAMRAQLEALDDDYMRERAADMDAIGQSILAALHGHGSALRDLPPGAIIIAPDLTPAETAELRSGMLAGFATAYGGPTGHTAILARALGIPAVVGLGAAALDLPDGAELVLDGGAALLIGMPSQAERAEYTRRADALRADAARRMRLRDVPGRLAGGEPIGLWANVGHPDEAKLALEHGAEGIGLFRTEFLFLDRTTPPGEQEQLNAYRRTLETMAGRPVVIRTIDIGGDKPLPYLNMPHEDNPFLGVRGLRLCMQRADLFATQLRALLRAATHGDLWIMLPMVATLDDLRWGRAQLAAAATALAAEGLPHRADVRLGIMIETPAAAVTADLFAREAAFFSVGSNDLTQYTMAADRGLAGLAARYPHDAPAVLRLIGMAADAAARAGIPIGVCGELAGVPAAAPILAGLGVNELSMAPAMIAVIKEQLQSTTLAQARAAAQAATHTPAD
ncbi:MAG: phosphoenolpyruvate--protein phosphotransferase [Kouleothrix sp.]|jgi:phosphotransferase system enzyme I (PtsI)|nr:phosphoenolpyruvate--protein phosphotransferase [Kouleothrix sp.]